MTSIFRRSLGLAAVAAALFASEASAASINNATGLTNPWATVTFSELGLANETTVTTQYQGLFGVSFAAFGVNYQAGGAGGIPSSDTLGNFTYTQSQNLLAYPFEIRFTAPQTAAAFQLGTNSGVGSTKIEALLNGVVVETFTPTTGTSPTGNYYGFENILFDTIRITPPGDNVNVTAALLMDNLQVSVVPEPATLAVLGGGLLALGVAIRRRRAAH